LALTSVYDTRDTIANVERKIGVLSRANLDNFARVICSADCPDICVEGVRWRRERKLVKGTDCR
jgi:hypothetical protein